MPEEAETSGAERKTKKKSAKKVASLRPRPDLLNNPALSGAAHVAARSVLGQGPGVQPVMATTPPTTSAQEPLSVPAPSKPPHAPSSVPPRVVEAVSSQAEDRQSNGGVAAGTPRSTSASAPEERSSPPTSAAETTPDLAGQSSAPEQNSTPPESTTPSEVVPSGLPTDPEHDSSADTRVPAAFGQTEQTPEGLPRDDESGRLQPEAHDDEHNGELGQGKPASEESADASGEGLGASSGSRRKRSAASRTGSKVGPAHQALLNSWRNSRVDLKLRRDSWQTHPFRFAADLVTVLSKRVAQDCSSSGKSLTAAQYVDAAMSLYLPASIKEQLQLAEEFLLSRETDVGTGKQASHRVSPEVYAIAAPLANDLREAGHARIAVHVYSGALDRFLRALEAEGPLGK